uniref:Serine palmitoyltransferase small subunit B n=1 Tax=Ciona intestinalis TaxID=7719 RepID=H2XUX1_CIOIN
MGFDFKLFGKKPTSVVGYIEWLYFIYCITTGIYMLDPWERTVFNTCLILLLSMSFYTAYAFLPQHIFAMLSHFGLMDT